MLVALTVRRLKPGTLDHYRNLFESVDQPQGWTRSYVVRNINDQDEIVDYAGWRARVDELVDSTGADGIFEVVVEKTP